MPRRMPGLRLLRRPFLNPSGGTVGTEPSVDVGRHGLRRRECVAGRVAGVPGRLGGEPVLDPPGLLHVRSRMYRTIASNSGTVASCLRRFARDEIIWTFPFTYPSTGMIRSTDGEESGRHPRSRLISSRMPSTGQCSGIVRSSSSRSKGIPLLEALVRSLRRRSFRKLISLFSRRFRSVSERLSRLFERQVFTVCRTRSFTPGTFMYRERMFSRWHALQLPRSRSFVRDAFTYSTRAFGTQQVLQTFRSGPAPGPLPSRNRPATSASPLESFPASSACT